MSSYPLPLRPHHGLPIAVSLPRADTGALIHRVFVGWLILRTLAWTLVAFAQPNPPLDVVEWLAWGRQWQLGYAKHPPLAAWVAEFVYRLTPGSFLGLYLTSYLAVAGAIICVWRVARQVLPPRTALAATLCLDGVLFLGSAAAEFNNQVLLLAFWAFAIERFVAAVRDDRRRDWVLVGLALGLAMLCKYSTVLLIVPLAGWWVWQAQARRWHRLGLVAGVAFMVVLPHLVWLIANNFPPLRYAAQRMAGDEGAMDPRLSGISFLFTQALRVLPGLLLLLPLLKPVWRNLDAEGRQVRSLLLAAVVGPIALHLALALLVGVHLRDIWGAPLWTFAGLLLVLCVETVETGRAWRRTRLLWAVVFVTSLTVAGVANVYGSGLRDRPMRIHCPGALLAEEVTARYQQRYGQPPAIIAGDWWLAGNVCCHARHRPMLYGSREPSAPGLDVRTRREPQCFLSPEPGASPWTSDADLLARGGVLVWDAEVYGEDVPPWLQARYPQAQGQRGLRLRVQGGSAGELRVGWAMVGPGG